MGIFDWLSGGGRKGASLLDLREPYDFLALDFETADRDHRVCAVGLAAFHQGEAIWQWTTLVDPGVPIDPYNYSIHLIEDDDVRGMPKFRDLAGPLHRLLHRSTVAAHGNTEAVVVRKEYERCRRAVPDVGWVDTVRVAKSVWPELKDQAGYRLEEVCGFLAIDIEAHDALEDARAAGEVLLRALEETGHTFDSLDQMLAATRRTPRAFPRPVTRAGQPNGGLSGQAVVFTGALSLSREEAADLAAAQGLDVKSSVSSKVSLLVVGDQDLSTLAGHTKSTKHRKAEELAAAGHAIRIIGESEFLRLVGKT